MNSDSENLKVSETPVEMGEMKVKVNELWLDHVDDSNAALARSRFLCGHRNLLYNNKYQVAATCRLAINP